MMNNEKYEVMSESRLFTELERVQTVSRLSTMSYFKENALKYFNYEILVPLKTCGLYFRPIPKNGFTTKAKMGQVVTQMCPWDDKSKGNCKKLNKSIKARGGYVPYSIALEDLSKNLEYFEKSWRYDGSNCSVKSLYYIFVLTSSRQSSREYSAGRIGAWHKNQNIWYTVHIVSFNKWYLT